MKRKEAAPATFDRLLIYTYQFEDSLKKAKGAGI
jgi:hypothetical protein